MFFLSPPVAACTLVTKPAMDSDGLVRLPRSSCALEFCPTGKLIAGVSPRLSATRGAEDRDSREFAVTLATPDGKNIRSLKGTFDQGALWVDSHGIPSDLAPMTKLVRAEVTGTARCVTEQATHRSRGSAGHLVTAVALDASNDLVTSKLPQIGFDAARQKLAHLLGHWVSLVVQQEQILGRVLRVDRQTVTLSTPAEVVRLDESDLLRGAFVSRMGLHAHVEATSADPNETALEVLQRFERGVEVEVHASSENGRESYRFFGRFLEVAGLGTSKPCVLIEDPLSYAVTACPLFQASGCWRLSSLTTQGYDPSVAEPFWSGQMPRGSQISGGRVSNVPKTLMVRLLPDAIRRAELL